MKHNVKNKKLGRSKEHRLSLRYNLVRSLVLYEKIITTKAKMNFFVPFLEKLITKAKVPSLSVYREILSHMRNDEFVSKKIIDLARKFDNRSGGFVEKFKLNNRKGDGADQCLIRFISEVN